MNFAFASAFFASVLFGAADLWGGLAARRAPAALVAMYSAFAALALLFVAMPFIPGRPATPDLLWGAAAGVASTAGSALIFKALALGPMSLASPVLCIVGLCLPVLVGVALGERPSPVAWAGVAIAALAIPALAQTDEGGESRGRAHIRRTLLVSIAAGLAAGCFLTCVGRIGSSAGLAPLIVARSVSIAIFIVVFLAMRRPLLPPANARPLAALAGATDSAANVAYWIATHGAPMSLAASLVSLAPATTVLIARVFLGERWTGWQKVGLVLALASGALISRG